jgi:hypothetical protein
MSRAPLVALLLCAGCGKGTTLLLDVQGSAPAGLHLNVWGPSARIGGTDLESPGPPPGRLRLAGLPGRDQTIRIAFMNGKFGPPVGALRVMLRADQETEAQVTLDSFPLTDRDDDRVPEEIDNCPMDKNFDQADGDENGAGDACPNMVPPDFAMTPLDLLTDDGPDMAMPCLALFCDDFETDSLSAGTVFSQSGTALWRTGEVNPPNALVALDNMRGALSSGRSLRFDVVGTLNDMGTPFQYDRYFPYAYLDGTAPNFIKITNGPMYVRFFARTSRSPADLYTGNTSSATVYWGPLNVFENLTLFAGTSGVDWTARFGFANPVATPSTTSHNTVWHGADWVCVEWENVSIPRDMGGVSLYTAKIQLASPGEQPSQVATFTGGDVPQQFGGLVLGPDVEIRPERPNLTSFSMWFDEIIIDDKPIGCTRRR